MPKLGQGPFDGFSPPLPLVTLPAYRKEEVPRYSPVHTLLHLREPLEMLHKILKCVSIVEEYGKLQFSCQLEVLLEASSLNLSRREHPVVWRGGGGPNDLVIDCDGLVGHQVTR